MELRACLIGFGKVGRSFASLLIKNKKILEKINVEFKVVCIYTRKYRLFNDKGIELDKAIFSLDNLGERFDDINDIMATKNIDFLMDFSVSSFTNGEPGYSLIKCALNNGINVITVSKAPLALHFRELIELAKKRNKILRYQGTVMSGTPAVNLKEILPSLVVDKIRGILNGTTNFILTKMEEGFTFEDALFEAKKLGYAEEDPSIDIKGIDSAAKLVILANTYFDENYSLENVKISGIESISKGQVDEATKNKSRIKLIASVEKDNLIVQPKMLKDDDIFFNIIGINNCVEFDTQYGRILLSGPGAGALNTAYGAFSDLILSIKQIFNR